MTGDELSRTLDAIPGFRESYAAMYPDEELCMAVARARGRRDMTQKQFARLVGISKKALRRLESGNLGDGR